MEPYDIIRELVDKARAAQAQAESYTQSRIDEVCLAAAWQVYKDDNIAELAGLAVEETGMGNVPDKIAKHKNKVLGVVRDVMKAKSVGLIEEDAAKGIRKYAKPVGVVGALTPVTNPTATPSSNAVSILKGRNAVIFAPHPSAKRATARAVELMRQGLRVVGAPEDLIQVVAEPSLELTGEMMRQVDLVVATGGGPMVKAAYSSGTPAYGVGPGNSCQIIAEDADIADAAAKITASKNFDYATSCSSENSLVIQSGVYDAMLAALESKGAHLCTAEEREKLRSWMWRLNKKGTLSINPKIVARSAAVIAEGAGFAVPGDTTMLVVEGAMPLEEDLFAQEKLSPVLAVFRYRDFGEGLDILVRLIDNCGRGHSCGIHIFNRDYIDKLSETMKCSRIMVRQPQAAANGGAFFNGMPSTVTLGCGSWGGNITTENITCKHFLNVTWVSEPIEPSRPVDEDIWGGYFEKYGR